MPTPPLTKEQELFIVERFALGSKTIPVVVNTRGRTFQKFANIRPAAIQKCVVRFRRDIASWEAQGHGNVPFVVHAKKVVCAFDAMHAECDKMKSQKWDIIYEGMETILEALEAYKAVNKAESLLGGMRVSSNALLMEFKEAVYVNSQRLHMARKLCREEEPWAKRSRVIEERLEGL
jgi:hypothetical protein